MMDKFCRHNELFRLLRDDENPQKDGLTAQLPKEDVSVQDFVIYGSELYTQFISTSATWDAIVTFSNYKTSYPKRIARINLENLKHTDDVCYIDLTEKKKQKKISA